MSRRGLTLIELLVTAVMMVFVSLAGVQCYLAAIRYNDHARAARNREEARIRFEDRVTSLLRHAWVDSAVTNFSSYFIGQIGSSLPTSTLQTTTTVSGQIPSSNGSLLNTADTLVFTEMGSRLSGAVLTASDDFKTLNKSLGAHGGATEVEISMHAVGDTASHSGAFIRTQVPADTDPSQGGSEQVLDPDLASLGFEFYNGSSWATRWTTLNGVRRLPSAVRVTYQVNGEDDARVFVVQVPASDVSSTNPAPSGVSS
jgi:type II secretory pathway pseudopilin PulG